MILKMEKHMKNACAHLIVINALKSALPMRF